MSPRKVDDHGVRFNQTLVGVLSIVAIAFDLPLIVLALAGILAVGAILGLRYAPFGVLYRLVVKPLTGLDGPREAAPPKRFAQTMGATFLGLASVGLFATGGLVRVGLGWGLTGMVAVLALLAGVTDLCVACRIYPAVQRFTGTGRPADG